MDEDRSPQKRGNRELTKPIAVESYRQGFFVNLAYLVSASDSTLEAYATSCQELLRR